MTTSPRVSPRPIPQQAGDTLAVTFGTQQRGWGPAAVAGGRRITLPKTPMAPEVAAYYLPGLVRLALALTEKG